MRWQLQLWAGRDRLYPTNCCSEDATYQVKIQAVVTRQEGGHMGTGPNCNLRQSGKGGKLCVCAHLCMCMCIFRVVCMCLSFVCMYVTVHAYVSVLHVCMCEYVCVSMREHVCMRVWVHACI